MGPWLVPSDVDGVPKWCWKHCILYDLEDQVICKPLLPHPVWTFVCLMWLHLTIPLQVSKNNVHTFSNSVLSTKANIFTHVFRLIIHRVRCKGKLFEPQISFQSMTNTSRCTQTHDERIFTKALFNFSLIDTCLNQHVEATQTLV